MVSAFSKAVILWDPVDEVDFFFTAIFYQGKHLSFISRDGARKRFEGSAGPDYSFSYALCFEGRIYALNGIGDLFLIEMDSDKNCPRATNFAQPPQDEWTWDDACLLESSGDLLMIQKLECRRDAVCFEAYRFDFSYDDWIELDNLGERRIFVGGNHSMAISASSLGTNCRLNCIYFSWDGIEQWWHCREDEGRDMAVYNVWRFSGALLVWSGPPVSPFLSYVDHGPFLSVREHRLICSRIWTETYFVKEEFWTDTIISAAQAIWKENSRKIRSKCNGKSTPVISILSVYSLTLCVGSTDLRTQTIITWVVLLPWKDNITETYSNY